VPFSPALTPAVPAGSVLFLRLSRFFLSFCPSFFFAMSIAMTALVAPSRRLRFVLGGFGASLLLAALAVALEGPLRFTAGPAVPGALLFAGLCVLHAAALPATVHRIDISGPGQIRLTVQQDVGTQARGGVPVALLPGSTLSPRLLLLRLGEAGGGPCRHLAVLPDSVAPEAFRGLVVAFGAALGPVAVSSTEHKIL
jgi:hypothetical protein